MVPLLFVTLLLLINGTQCTANPSTRELTSGDIALDSRAILRTKHERRAVSLPWSGLLPRLSLRLRRAQYNAPLNIAPPCSCRVVPTEETLSHACTVAEDANFSAAALNPLLSSACACMMRLTLCLLAPTVTVTVTVTVAAVAVVAVVAVAICRGSPRQSDGVSECCAQRVDGVSRHSPSSRSSSSSSSSSCR